jgi:protein-L-isoaspartate(D-aspartate) O-methyltransferase
MSLPQLDAPAAYDAIAVTASLARVPENLKLALKPGGRLFIVVGDSPVMQALLITRVGDSEWTTRSLFETDLPRLRQ